MSAHAATLAQLGAPRAPAQSRAAAGRMCSAAAPAPARNAAAATSAWRSTGGRKSVLCARSARPRALRCGRVTPLDALRRSPSPPAQSVRRDSRRGQRCGCAGARRRGARRALGDSALRGGTLSPPLWLAARPVSVAARSLLEVLAAAHHPRHGAGHQLGASYRLRTRARTLSGLAGRDPRAVGKPGADRLGPRASGTPGLACAAVRKRVHRGHQPGAFRLASAPRGTPGPVR